MADCGVSLQGHGEGQVGAGGDGHLTEGQHDGEHLGVPEVAPDPEQVCVDSWYIQNFPNPKWIFVHLRL